MSFYRKEDALNMKKLIVVLLLVVFAILVTTRDPAPQAQAQDGFCSGAHTACTNQRRAVELSCIYSTTGSFASCFNEGIRAYNACMGAHQCSGPGSGTPLPEIPEFP